MEERRCPYCDEIISLNAKKCKHCGEYLDPVLAKNRGKSVNDSEKKILTVFLLAWFLGAFGIHRFYVGKTGSAILQLLTFGGFGIWVIIDIISIITGNFTDSDGKKITQWT